MSQVIMTVVKFHPIACVEFLHIDPNLSQHGFHLLMSYMTGTLVGLKGCGRGDRGGWFVSVTR
jgi:hypothetical protein